MFWSPNNCKKSCLCHLKSRSFATKMKRFDVWLHNPYSSLSSICFLSFSNSILILQVRIIDNNITCDFLIHASILSIFATSFSLYTGIIKTQERNRVSAYYSGFISRSEVRSVGIQSNEAACTIYLFI